jgi:hypothetical protein
MSMICSLKADLQICVCVCVSVCLYFGSSFSPEVGPAASVFMYAKFCPECGCRTFLPYFTSTLRNVSQDRNRNWPCTHTSDDQSSATQTVCASSFSQTISRMDILCDVSKLEKQRGPSVAISENIVCRSCYMFRFQKAISRHQFIQAETCMSRKHSDKAVIVTESIFCFSVLP